VCLLCLSLSVCLSCLLLSLSYVSLFLLSFISPIIKCLAILLVVHCSVFSCFAPSTRSPVSACLMIVFLLCLSHCFVFVLYYVVLPYVVLYCLILCVLRHVVRFCQYALVRERGAVEQLHKTRTHDKGKTRPRHRQGRTAKTRPHGKDKTRLLVQVMVRCTSSQVQLGRGAGKHICVQIGSYLGSYDCLKDVRGGGGILQPMHCLFTTPHQPPTLF
jgi:hypothetical protein